MTEIDSQMSEIGGLTSRKTKRLAASTVSIRQALNCELGLKLAKQHVPGLSACPA
jgi:hypothetical protein